MIGRILDGRWRLNSLIGRGGMATVYLSEDEAGQPVAVKLLRSEFVNNQEVRHRLAREADLAKKVDHPATVRIIDLATSQDGEPYIVMEFLRGRSISQILERLGKPLPLRLALEITKWVLSFLSVCHKQGIIHRDVKPSNIFLLKTGQVKVLDLGVARDPESSVELTVPGQTLGTPSFMSPEQASGCCDLIDERSDVFSLGATLYTMLSNKTLHEASSNEQAHVLAATRQAPSLAEVTQDMPWSVVEVVDKAIAYDPDRRFQTASKMYASVARIFQELTDDGEPGRDHEDKASTPKPRMQVDTGSASAVDAGRTPDPVSRLGDTLVAALQSSQAAGDTTRIQVRLSQMGQSYLAENRGSELAAVVNRVENLVGDRSFRQMFRAFLFTASNSRLLFEKIEEERDQPKGNGESETLGDLVSMVASLPSSRFDQVCESLKQAPDDVLKVPLLAYVGRYTEGNELKLGQLLGELHPSVALEVIEHLKQLGNKQAAQALKEAAKHSDLKVRFAALDARSALNPNDCLAELEQLLSGEDAAKRMSALRLIGQNSIRQAVPLLAERTGKRAFHQCSDNEKHLLLGLLKELDPAQAKTVLIGLAKRSIVADRGRRNTKQIAAKMLTEP